MKINKNSLQVKIHNLVATKDALSDVSFTNVVESIEKHIDPVFNKE